MRKLQRYPNAAQSARDCIRLDRERVTLTLLLLRTLPGFTAVRRLADNMALEADVAAPEI